jgi:hypothetical protein
MHTHPAGTKTNNKTMPTFPFHRKSPRSEPLPRKSSAKKILQFVVMLALREKRYNKSDEQVWEREREKDGRNAGVKRVYTGRVVSWYEV